MLYQLEVTTRCNYSCFYCVGRDMPQKDMSWDTFQSIIDAIPGEGKSVSLQGEGEPSLHPQFEDMTKYVLRKGHKPYTILNGSRLNVEVLAQLFPTLGISIDTLDARMAEDIGRHNLPKVLRNLEELERVMAPDRITIMTVDMGQNLDDLKEWVIAKGFGKHVIQRLSTKADYARRYTVSPVLMPKTQPSVCKYLQRPTSRFYTWQGKELPCCFMKDHSDFTTVFDLRSKLLTGEAGKTCQGCSKLRPIQVKVQGFRA